LDRDIGLVTRPVGRGLRSCDFIGLRLGCAGRRHHPVPLGSSEPLRHGLRRCRGAPARNSSKIKAVAVLRLDAGGRCVTGTPSHQHRTPRTRPLFDMGQSAAALRLRNTRSPHRITEELVDSKVALRGAYSADQRSAVRWIGERTRGRWSDGASLTIVLLLSLGVWAAIWRAVASLASASLL
jgi:hypothetical protein